MLRPITTGLAVLAAFALSIGSLAAADKVNLTYVEDAPSPIGKLTQDDFDDMAASDFTHYVFAFINFCTPATGGKFTCPGTDPVVVWNINAIDDPDGTAKAMMKGLSEAGKTIYLSVGGAWNDETWAYFASATDPERTAAMGALSTFMKNYYVTGIDLDFEPHDYVTYPHLNEGYRDFSSAIAADLSPIPPVSIAPYNCGAATDLVWQYCNLVGPSKITPTLINRQYYAGGAQCEGWSGPSPQMPGQVLNAIKADLVENNPNKAVSKLQRCLEIEPKNTAAMFKLGEIYFKQKRVSDAQKILEKAVSLNKENKWYLILLSDVYKTQKSYSKAIDVYKDLLKIEPKNIMYLSDLAGLYIYDKDYSNSLKIYNQIENEYGIQPDISIQKQRLYISKQTRPSYSRNSKTN